MSDRCAACAEVIPTPDTVEPIEESPAALVAALAMSGGQIVFGGVFVVHEGQVERACDDACAARFYEEHS